MRGGIVAGEADPAPTPGVLESPCMGSGGSHLGALSRAGFVLLRGLKMEAPSFLFIYLIIFGVSYLGIPRDLAIDLVSKGLTLEVRGMVAGPAVFNTGVKLE